VSKQSHQTFNPNPISRKERKNMKYIDNGCLHSVSVSKAEVLAFKSKWPCSGLPERAHWFQFDKRNGDLVDIRPSYYDGPDLLALSQVAGEFAVLHK
jgi:hypothetical protein